MVPGRDLGRYELLAELGRGGMAELCLGRLHGAGGFAKLVAIKRILPHLAQDPQFTRMFETEGRIAARLSHPNVCQVFELDEADGQLFLVMEYLEGVSLAELLEALRPARPEPRLIAGILAQAAEGLHYAHTLRDHAGVATPVVHRDVSPQNLFVTVDGVCKLLDFGVSKVTTDPSRTRSGVIKGKLPYMAPEQIRGDALDGRADVFALGVCAWEALAGERLFERASDFLTWQAITEEPVPSLATRWAGPPAAVAAIEHALARAPEARPATAQQFADELRGALGFASAAEIAATVRGACGAQLAGRAQLVSAAIQGSRVGAAEPRPSASVELRDQTASLARPTVPSRPAARPDAVATVVEVPRSPRRSRTGLIVAITTAAVVAIVAIGLLASRGPAPPAPPAPPDAAPRDEIDETIDRGLEDFDRGMKQLDRLKDLRPRLERLEQLRPLED